MLLNRKISVLLPTYNRAHTIKNAIQSILDQSYENWELIIIDDGSNDQTGQVVSKFKDPRIKYFKERHRGLVRTLNYGNTLCTGDIIVKQDSDDASMPNRLEVIDREMQTDFFYHGLYHIYFDQRDPEIICRNYRRALPPDIHRLLQEQYIPGCFAYTKQFSIDVPYRDVICSEDWMLCLDAVLKEKTISYVDQGLYEYVLQLDSNSIINERTGAYESDEKKMREYLQEYGIKDFKYAKRP